MSGTRRKPSISWAPHHNSLLLDMWKENIGAMRAAQKNNHIFQRMAEKLKEAGLVNVQWKDVRTKLDNMTRKYKEELKVQGTAGGANSKWVNFQQVHRILGNIKSIKVENCTDDNPIINQNDASMSIKMKPLEPGCFTAEINEPWDEASTSTLTQGRKRRKTDMSPYEAAMVDATNRRTDVLETIAKDFKELGERLLKILEKKEKTCDGIEEKHTESNPK